MTGKRTGTSSSEHVTVWCCGKHTQEGAVSAMPNRRSEFRESHTRTQFNTNVSLWKNQSPVPAQQTQGSFSGLVITTDKHHSYQHANGTDREA